MLLMVYVRYILYFNSHAHVERDEELTMENITNTNFNSHAHVERDLYFFAVTKAVHISTHTLTWSVTTPPNVSTKYWNISTHTLTWSVTFIT